MSKFQIVGSSVLIAIAMICGLFMLFFGIKDVVHEHNIAEGYQETDGYYSGSSIYASDEDGVTYRLTYTYVVDGKEYGVSTDYGTQIIPKENSTRTVKYDPADPSQAFIAAAGTGHMLIIMGLMFIGVPLIILFGMLYVMGYVQNFLHNVLDVGVGIVLIVGGCGAIYLITGELSLIKMFTSVRAEYILPLFIPVLLIAAGMFQFVKTLVAKCRKKPKRRGKKRDHREARPR